MIEMLQPQLVVRIPRLRSHDPKSEDRFTEGSCAALVGPRFAIARLSTFNSCIMHHDTTHQDIHLSATLVRITVSNVVIQSIDTRTHSSYSAAATVRYGFRTAAEQPHQDFQDKTLWMECIKFQI